MDRYLRRVLFNNLKFDDTEREYFKSFRSWDNFIKKHYLNGSYVSDDGEIRDYSNKHKTAKEVIKSINDIWEKRARAISESDVMESLWTYFEGNGLIDVNE
jgi:hypothetical protein